MIQFDIALNLNANFAANHWGFSQALYGLGMYERCEYHLKRILQIEPYFKDAQNKLDQLREFNSNSNSKHNHRFQCVSEPEMKLNSVRDHDQVMGDVYCREFDKFWFDGIAIINNAFNGYYDQFVIHKKNDILFLLSCDSDDIKEILRRDIGVYASEDIRIIMTEIEYLKKQHRDFKQCLKKVNLSEYYCMFEFHAIYSMNACKNKIKNEKDMQDLIRSYNDRSGAKLNELVSFKPKALMNLINSN